MLRLTVTHNKTNVKISTYKIVKEKYDKSDKSVSSLRIYYYIQGRAYDIKEKKEKCTFQMLKKVSFGYFLKGG